MYIYVYMITMYTQEFGDFFLLYNSIFNTYISHASLGSPFLAFGMMNVFLFFYN